MPPKKLPLSKLSRTAKFYRRSKKARAVKAKKDKEINERKDQREKRSKLNTRRRQDKRKGIDTSKTDLSHENGKLVRRSIKANRGNSDKDKLPNTKGDSRARGKKK